MSSKSGKELLLYLLFVAVAFVFWLLMSLDNEVQRDFDVPVELQDVPDSVTVITPVPQSINVSVKAKGSQLLRYLWTSHIPSLKFKFPEYARMRANSFFVSKARLESRLRDYFGNAAAITSCRPDSLKLLFTSSPGKRVPLIVDADIHPHLQSVISGPIRADVDSVTVYAVGDVPRAVVSATTEPLVRSGLRDTTRYQVNVKPIANMKVWPETVTVTVPVEPLISKKRSIPVEVLGMPANVSVVVFPSKVEVSYLVGMSDYSREAPLKAYANYADIVPGRSKIPLAIGQAPAFMHNISLQPDSVEYILEHLPVR